MKRVIPLFLALVLCLSLCACAGGVGKETSVKIVTKDGQTEYLSGKELLDADEANPVAFDEKYYEASVTVVSEITAIHGRSSLNGHDMNAYIELKGGWIVEAATASVVSDLVVGDTVEITGKIWGTFASDIYIYCINGHTTTIEKYSG